MGHNKPVNKTLAEGCMERYVKIYGSTTDPKLKKAYSTSASFNRADLIAWLNTVNTDAVNVAFGVYTDKYVAQYPTAIEGRLAAFFLPMIAPPTAAAADVFAKGFPGDGGTDDPGDDFAFNLGTLTP